MSMSSSVLALVASYIDSSNGWLSDFNNTEYGDLSIGLEHNR